MNNIIYRDNNSLNGFASDRQIDSLSSSKLTFNQRLPYLIQNQPIESITISIECNNEVDHVKDAQHCLPIRHSVFTSLVAESQKVSECFISQSPLCIPQRCDDSLPHSAATGRFMEKQFNLKWRSNISETPGTRIKRAVEDTSNEKHCLKISDILQPACKTRSLNKDYEPKSLVILKHLSPVNISQTGQHTLIGKQKLTGRKILNGESKVKHETSSISPLVANRLQHQSLNDCIPAFNQYKTPSTLSSSNHDSKSHSARNLTLKHFSKFCESNFNQNSPSYLNVQYYLFYLTSSPQKKRFF